MSHTHTVYQIRNTVNGKCYVGVTTKTLAWRFKQHSYQKGSPLYSDMRAYGRGIFVIEEISRLCDKAEALTAEDDAIKNLGTLAPRGYNRDVRGNLRPRRGGGFLGNTNSRRTRVAQLTSDGKTVCIHETIMDASKALGIHRKTIHRAINQPSYFAGGFKWKKAG